ncbi:MAG: DNA mismatch repair protein MutS [Rickettsiales bacterium]|nr:DNA mismatch repair protein MutS [Rickettsiales bacterium]
MSGENTPVIEHYLSLKEARKDCLLLYRIGDFYECFFDDAKAAAEALNIQLTSRGGKVPMAGIPHHAFDSYMPRLVAKGFKVAVCDQLETPEQARERGGAKAIIRRGVTRIFTAATLTEDTLLEASANNFLCSIAASGTLDPRVAVALVDISTGEVETSSPPAGELHGFLLIRNPSEVIVPPSMASAPRFSGLMGDIKERLVVRPLLDDATAGALVARQWPGRTLDIPPLETVALANALSYVALTQMGAVPGLKMPEKKSGGAVMAIDSFSVANLEIFDSQGGADGPSLFKVMARARTAKGKRLLRARLAAPLADAAKIRARLDEVQYFFDRPGITRRARDILGEVADLERILARAAMGRAGPADIYAAAAALQKGAEIKSLMEDNKDYGLNAPREIAARIKSALSPNPPATVAAGGFVREGFDASLDALRRLSGDARRFLLELQARYALDECVPGLKIKYNNLAGYFIEVPARNAAALVGKKPFVHKQTLASCARFTTPELARLEGEILSAGEKCRALELEIFAGLSSGLVAVGEEIKAFADELARLDVAAGLADAALAHGWTRPGMDDSLDFCVKEGRHPVVEAALGAQRKPFVPNDADFGESQRLWLLTGPNMSGKSTFLRQNALIAVMAQSGSFVPAQSARIGVVSKLMSRVGASDNLARGLSTFLVEMTEPAAILERADARSFVILDEIGRGTATWDGLAIAMAALEFLAGKSRCRGVFATHYHELVPAAAALGSVAAYTLEVKDAGEGVVFMHKVVRGAAQSSYGLQVAKLAGLPKEVLSRASEVLRRIELDGRIKEDDLFSFRPPSVAGPEPPVSADSRETEKALDVVARLSGVDPDSLSPKDALELLYEIKKLLAA